MASVREGYSLKNLLFALQWRITRQCLQEMRANPFEHIGRPPYQITRTPTATIQQRNVWTSCREHAGKETSQAGKRKERTLRRSKRPEQLVTELARKMTSSLEAAQRTAPPSPCHCVEAQRGDESQQRRYRILTVDRQGYAYHWVAHQHLQGRAVLYFIFMEILGRFELSHYFPLLLAYSSCASGPPGMSHWFAYTLSLYGVVKYGLFRTTIGMAYG